MTEERKREAWVDGMRTACGLEQRSDWRMSTRSGRVMRENTRPVWSVQETSAPWHALTGRARVAGCVCRM